MALTTFSAREFNQQVGRAKKCAKDGPVFITDRGVETHVLLDVEEYRKITHSGKSLTELLFDPAVAEIDFEFDKIELDFKPVEFQ
jgi:prevent-host-death family protein